MRLPKLDVLLVEDDESIRSLLADALDTSGLVLRFAETGEDAVRQLHLSSPDVVILDLHIPVPTGVNILPLIPFLAIERAPRVVVLTGDHSQTIEQLQTLGASEVIYKPFDLRALEEAVYGNNRA